jgi:hypothetical protein
MVTRRTLLKQSACAALAWRAAPALIGTAYAASVSPSGFDYYIGPDGEDSNPGTYARPWSITAINTHRAVYAGKRVGLLDGTYNVHDLCQKGSRHVPALGVNGGPSADAPTVIAAVNPRRAILTGADPSGGAYPTNECAIIGQGYLQTPNTGNVVLDGLSVTRSYQYGILFYAPVGTEFQTALVEGGSTGFVVRNCEIYDIAGLMNDNIAGVQMWFCTGALISNNNIHSIQPPAPRPAGNGIQAFRCHSNIYEFNTIYDCSLGIYDKNNTNGNHTYRYNYIECAGLTPGSILLDGSGGNPGDTLTVHNNVLVGPSIFDGLDALVAPSPQSLLFYNNTCVFGGPKQADRGIFYPAGGNTISPAAMVTIYNNIVQCTGQVGYGGLLSLCAGTIALSDFNVLSAVGSNPLMSLVPVTQPRAVPRIYSLADWRSVTGMDRHSTTSAATFASAMDRTPTGFQLRAGSTHTTAGRVGGVASGAPTAVGAWGGGATQIGCNFGPAPKPVPLSVS